MEGSPLDATFFLAVQSARPGRICSPEILKSGVLRRNGVAQQLNKKHTWGLPQFRIHTKMSNMRILDLQQWHHIFASLLLVCFGALLFDYARILYRRSKMPPGPLPLPTVGNVLQLPKEKPWYRFEEWSKKVQQAGYHGMDWTESNRGVERRLNGK